MGVTGLWHLIESSGKPVPFETLEDKVIVIDISIWLHQVVKGYTDGKGGHIANAHLLGLFSRICKLLYFRIKPIFVFDGKTCNLKWQTLSKRAKQKSKLKTEAEKIEELLLQSLAKEKVLKEALGLDVKALTLSPNKKKPVKTDEADSIFKLPEHLSIKNEKFTVKSEDIDEEFSSSKKSYNVNINKIDLGSSYFKSLAPEVRHDILVDIKDTRKQNTWANLRQLPVESDNFSSYQMNGLLRRRQVQVSLEEAEKEMGGKVFSLSELETLLAEDGILDVDSKHAQRIAGDEGTRFLLVRDITKAISEAKQRDAVKIEPKPSTSKYFGQQPNKLVYLTDSDDDDLELQKAIQMSLGNNEDCNILENKEDINEPIKLNAQQRKKFVGSIQSHGLVKGFMKEYGEMNDEDINDMIDATQVEDVPKDDSLSQKFPHTDRYVLYGTPEKSQSNGVEATPEKSPSSSFEEPKDQKKLDTATEEKKEIVITFDSANYSQEEDIFADIFESPKDEVILIEKEAVDVEIASISDDDTIEYEVPEEDFEELDKDIKEIESKDAKIIESAESNLIIDSEESNEIVSENDKFWSNLADDESSDVKLDVKSEAQIVPEKSEIEKFYEIADENFGDVIEIGDSEEELTQVEPKIEEKLEPESPKIKEQESAKIKEQESPKIKEQESLKIKEQESPKIKEQESPKIKEQESPKIKEQESPKIKEQESPKIKEQESPKIKEQENPKIKEQESPKIKEPDDIIQIDSDKAPEVILDKTIKFNNKEIKQPIERTPEKQPQQLTQQEQEEVATAAEILRQELTDEQLLKMEEDLKKQQKDYAFERNKLDRQGTSITDSMSRDCKELLKLFGIPYIDAPTEAEAQCAFLNAHEIADGIITDDSDVWLFGAKTVYKNFFLQKKIVKQFEIQDIENRFKLNRNKLIQLAMLVGSDYTVGIHGIGAVTAMEILAAFPPTPEEENGTDEYQSLMSSLRKFRDWYENGKQDMKHKGLKSKLKTVELISGFPNLNVAKAYLEPKVDTSLESFSWGIPDEESIFEYTKYKLGWTRLKTKEILDPVMKRLKERKQKKMEDYFKVQLQKRAYDEKLSKRVEKAVKRLSGNEKYPDGQDDEVPEKKVRKPRAKKAAQNDNNEDTQNEHEKKPRKRKAPAKKKVNAKEKKEIKDIQDAVLLLSEDDDFEPPEKKAASPDQPELSNNNLSPQKNAFDVMKAADQSPKKKPSPKKPATKGRKRKVKDDEPQPSTSTAGLYDELEPKKVARIPETKQVIPQREKDKAEQELAKQKAIEIFKNSKLGLRKKN